MATLTLEQERVINHDAGNILVSASAGSGKTHTMIERVKRIILEAKADVKEVLAVTFTEMAASDMKDKLKKALAQKIDETSDKRLIEQLGEVATADISTLHAFCGRLIRTYFFAVGVSPDFKILDESDSAVIRAECIDKTFSEFYRSGEEWFLTLVDRHAVSRSDFKLKELVLSAYAFCDSESDPERILHLYQYYYSENGLNFLVKELKRYLDKTVNFIKKDVENAKKIFEINDCPKAVQLADSILFDINTVLNSDSLEVVCSYFDYSPKLYFDRKMEGETLKAKAKLTECRDKLKKLFKKYNSRFSGFNKERERVQTLYEHTNGFVKIIRRFSEIYTEEKREENCLDFNDLEHFALKILSDPEIEKDVKQKYKYVFVDEYQDTNGVQEELLLKISELNLLMVGDVKQSIYGFRGCRPEIFANKFKSMLEKGEEVVRLNKNFRSSVAVVNMVNEVFNFCMTEEFFGENYKGNSELVFGGLYPDDMPGRAELHFLKKEKKEAQSETPRIYDVIKSAEQPCEDEVSQTASLITKIIQDELGKKYYNAKEKKEKNVTLGDIAILTRSRENEYVHSLVKGLVKHGIPVVSDVKENVCDFPEISMLVNVLKLIDCFMDDIPLATTLKSPIGGFSDEDLMEIACAYIDDTKDKSGSFYVAFNHYIKFYHTSLKKRLVDFSEYFDRIRMLSDFIGAKEILLKIIEDKNLESCFLAEKNGKTKVARLKRFISAATVGEHKFTVKEFLYKVETSEDAFGYSESGEEDAVKLLTIHKSKGLEFPVVIVCGLERAMNTQDEYAEILFSREEGFAVKYYDDNKRTKEETLLRGIIAEKKREELVKEEMRLLYVALTRATYSLHLTFCMDEDKRNSEFALATKFIDYIPDSINATVHTESEFDFINLTKGTRKVIVGKSDQNKVEQMKSNFDFHYPNLVETTLPLKSNVTEAIKKDNEEGYTYVLFDEESPDVERGNLAHKFMEFLDFSMLDNVDGQLKKMIDDGIIAKEDAQKVNFERLKKALKADAIKDLKDKKLYREKSFITQIEANKIFNVESCEPVLLQGIIDLLVIDGEFADVVDYKYSSLTTEGLVAKYKGQLELYSYAVEKLLSKKVRSKTILNLFTGESVNV